MSNKEKKKRVVKVVRHSFEGGIEQVLDIVKGQNAKIVELIDKHNEIAKAQVESEKRQQQIAIFSAQEFGKLLAQQQGIANEVGKSIDHLDMNVLATAEILKEVFGQFAQIDELLKRTGGSGISLDLSESETEDIKTKALTWFKDVVSSSFQIVRARRDAEEKARMEALQAEKEAAEKAVADKTEAEKVESELLAAQAVDRGIQAVGAQGGPGAPIPEGADVFGG